MTKKIRTKVNCRNRVDIEGLAININHVSSNQSDNVLTFTLVHINSAKGIAYKTYVDVYLYGNRAIQVGGWLTEYMPVSVEGKLRLSKEGASVSIQGVHVMSTKPKEQDITITIPSKKEEQHND